MIKQVILTALAGTTLIFNTGVFAQQCKVKPIVKAGMPKLAPYQYDSYALKEISFGPKPKKETTNFEVFSEEEYKLVFCQTELPQEIGITIYGKIKGEKKILYFDESGKKVSQDFSFGPTKSGTYYIEYEIPAATSPNQKGCFVLLIGVKE